MRNIKLIIAYDGTNYAGWQSQPSNKKSSFKIKTIQNAIEVVLFKLLQHKVTLIASGRTDSGVHANAQAANFKTKNKISLRKLKNALNGLLPSDIVVKSASLAKVDFHARFDCVDKHYRYRILNKSYCEPFLRNYVYFYPYCLDVSIMKKEAKDLHGRHDFSCFQASDKVKKDATRTIKKITVKKNKDFIIVDVIADGFVYNMVRNIVGTLIEAGRGRFEKGIVKMLLRKKNRNLAGPTAPAKGLMLYKVNYAKN
ncbi:MAG: tRNA pseudouridine(38-40) synthase TruA [Candidatus Gygaella obscura]|nr:tRNA pseudouridine(38-40) synthase TruA [Candidatus Gygaella obscura]